MYVTSAFGSVDLKISMSKGIRARHFSFHLHLLRCLLLGKFLGTSLTVEYPSECVPPLSGEDGGEFQGHSFAGWDLGGLPCGQLVGALATHPHTMYSAGPVLTAILTLPQ